MNDETKLWLGRAAAMAQFAERQLFLVGGAPRSGTTWIQTILDAHPEVCCRGEGLFSAHFAKPLDDMARARAAAIEGKNKRLFTSTGGYHLPHPADTDHLLGTAILLALERQTGGGAYRAVGEKTPENVFLFERFKGLFPSAKFIGVARDPRDVIASAWHMFKSASMADSAPAKIEFIRLALPSVAAGGKTMATLLAKYPSDCMVLTYERMVCDPAPQLGAAFRMLGVSDRPDIVAACLEKASFDKVSGGRPAGVEDRRAFYRKGVAGDWRSTLTEDMGALIVTELGWMYPQFGWTP